MSDNYYKNLANLAFLFWFTWGELIPRSFESFDHDVFEMPGPSNNLADSRTYDLPIFSNIIEKYIIFVFSFIILFFFSVKKIFETERVLRDRRAGHIVFTNHTKQRKNYNLRKK